MTDQISNLESGLSARQKINETISKANSFDNKVDKVPTAQEGNAAVWGPNGELLDGGIAPGGGAQTNIPQWEDVRFDPLPINYVVQYSGRLFASKVPDNTNNQPPEGTEDTYWKETSESKSGQYYAPGVYRSDPTVVIRSNGQYLLNNALVTFPYVSADFDTELAANIWLPLSGTGGNNWSVVRIDSSVSTTFNAAKNVIYLIDASVAPVTAVLPDAVALNRDEFWFVLDKNTHKVTVRTENLQLISGYTEQLIPTVSGTLRLKAYDTGYDIISDTRLQLHIERLTADRAFTTDGIENNILYLVDPQGADLHFELPPPTSPAGGDSISASFLLVSAGTATIFCATDTIGGAVDQVLNVIGTSIAIIEADSEYFVGNDTRPKVVQTALTTYPLSEDSTITDTLTGTFFKQRCTTTEDSRFNAATATELPGVLVTADQTDAYQLIGSSITDAGVLVGMVPEGPIDIYWNVRRSGLLNVTVMVRYYKRDNAGTETLLAQSSEATVPYQTYEQYFLSAVHSGFDMAATDRLIVRTYARKSSTGAHPTVYFNVEGPNPTRSALSVAANAISHGALPGRAASNSHPATAISVDASAFSGTLDSTVTDVQKLAEAVNGLDFGDVIPPVASGERVVTKDVDSVNVDKTLVEMEVAAAGLDALSWTGTTATYTGSKGQRAYGATHFYECIGTNTWVRYSLSEMRMQLYLTPDIDDSGGAKTSAELDTAYPSALIGQKVWGTTLFVYEKKATNIWRKTSSITA